MENGDFNGTDTEDFLCWVYSILETVLVSTIKSILKLREFLHYKTKPLYRFTDLCQSLTISSTSSPMQLLKSLYYFYTNI